jgi:hypothetical protein
MDYIHKLTSMEEKMANEDPFSALGVGRWAFQDVDWGRRCE